ncbi:MAG: arylamine N-acetyltransferase family protein [Stellaceae bacterium]
MDLDAYLARIGWSGPVALEAETLAALAAHHGRAIAYENLNPFLGLPVELDIGTLERKMVRGRRGGYCFEQNALFAAALRDIGFVVTGLGARVLWGRPETPLGPRSHMVLMVDLDGEPRIVDAGFGSTTPTGALRLIPEIEQQTTLEPFRLVERQGDWQVEAKIAGDWEPLYRFDLVPQLPADYAVANYFTATHPTSIFVKYLTLARPLDDRRYVLRNRDFAIHHRDGTTERRRLDSVAEIVDALETKFDLDTAGLPRLEQRLATLP